MLLFRVANPRSGVLRHQCGRRSFRWLCISQVIQGDAGSCWEHLSALPFSLWLRRNGIIQGDSPQAFQ